MSYEQDISRRARAKWAADKAARLAPKAAQTATPPSLPDVGPIDSGVTDKLADLYAQVFGSASQSGGQIVAVPVNPPAQGGGGFSLGRLLLLGGLGVGGFFLYKHMKGRAAA